jgi:hypothetical protein
MGIYDNAMKFDRKDEACYPPSLRVCGGKLYGSQGCTVVHTLHYPLDVRRNGLQQIHKQPFISCRTPVGQKPTRKLHQQAKHQTVVVEASHLQAVVNNAKAPSLPFHLTGAQLARRCRCGRLTASQALEAHLRTSGSCRCFQSFGARCRPSPRRPSKTWGVWFELR